MVKTRNNNNGQRSNTNNQANPQIEQIIASQNQPMQAVDNDEYLRYHLAGTRKAQGGVHYDSAHHPEDSRRP
jgi:hypothetical protein